MEKGRGGGESTHEEVVCFWDIAANAEELHEIVELAMNVAADGDGGVDDLDV